MILRGGFLRLFFVAAIVIALGIGVPAAGEASPATGAPPPGTPGYVIEPVLNLGKPKLTGVVSIPGTIDDVVAITQDGDLWKATLGGPPQSVSAFGSVRDRMTAKSDEGLLGITYESADASQVYINYTTGTEYYRPYSTAVNYPPTPVMPANPKRNRVARYDVVNGAMDMGSEEIIFESLRPQQWHTLNQLAFGPDGYLYAGSGDGGYIEAAFDSDSGQGVGNQLGTILRIDPNDSGPGYTIPPGNPFADGNGPNADEVWAYGLRNPWRISFDSETGKLWAADVGQWVWEEVDQIEGGHNYGWSVMEGSGCHTGTTCVPPANHTPPRTAFCNGYNGSPSCEFHDECAIIGGHVYRGSTIPALDGWYVFADFCSGRIRAVDTNSADSPPVMLADTDFNITSFGLTSTGEILIVDYSGALHQLTYDSDGDGKGAPFDNCADIVNADQADEDRDDAGDICDNCPSVSNGGQVDGDQDGPGDACDNCPAVTNVDQKNTDADGEGDVCDSDDDNDAVEDGSDNCPLVANGMGQADDADGDLAGDACDGPGSGNVDCSAPPAGVNALDALKVLRHATGLSVAQSEPCTDIGDGPLTSGWMQGDVNCSGGQDPVNSIDALLILRANAALSTNIPAGCPAIKPP